MGFYGVGRNWGGGGGGWGVVWGRISDGHLTSISGYSIFPHNYRYLSLTKKQVSSSEEYLS